MAQLFEIRHVKMAKENYKLLAECFKTNKVQECGESVVIFVEVINIFKFVEKLVTLSIPFEYLV